MTKSLVTNTNLQRLATEGNDYSGDSFFKSSIDGEDDAEPKKVKIKIASKLKSQRKVEQTRDCQDHLTDKNLIY